MQYAVYSIQNAVCSMQYTVCSMQYAAYSMQYAVYNIKYKVYCILSLSSLRCCFLQLLLHIAVAISIDLRSPFVDETLLLAGMTYKVYSIQYKS